MGGRTSLPSTIQTLARDFSQARAALERDEDAGSRSAPLELRLSARIEGLLEPVVHSLTSAKDARGFRRAAKDAAEAMRPLLAELPGPGILRGTTADTGTSEAFRLRGALELLAARKGPIGDQDFDILFRCALHSNERVSPGEARALDALAAWVLGQLPKAEDRAVAAGNIGALLRLAHEPADRFEQLERTLAGAVLKTMTEAVDPKGPFAQALREEIEGLKESIGFVDFGSMTGRYAAALDAELGGLKMSGGSAAERAAVANAAKQRAAALIRFIDAQEMPKSPNDFYSHFRYTVTEALESVLGVRNKSSW